jgi:hypothetical protein
MLHQNQSGCGQCDVILRTDVNLLFGVKTTTLSWVGLVHQVQSPHLLHVDGDLRSVIPRGGVAHVSQKLDGAVVNLLDVVGQRRVDACQVGQLPDAGRVTAVPSVQTVPEPEVDCIEVGV